MRSLDGELLGEHKGLMYHTIGQRQGLGMAVADHDDAPWYVVTNCSGKTLIVAQGNDHPALLKATERDGRLWVGDSRLLPRAVMQKSGTDSRISLHLWRRRQPYGSLISRNAR